MLLKSTVGGLGTQVRAPVVPWLAVSNSNESQEAESLGTCGGPRSGKPA